MYIKLKVKSSNTSDIRQAISVLQGMLPVDNTNPTETEVVKVPAKAVSDTPVTDNEKEERSVAIKRAKELGLEFRLSINTSTLVKRIEAEELRIIKADAEEHKGAEEEEEEEEQSAEDREADNAGEEEEAPAKREKSANPFNSVKKRNKKNKKSKKKKSSTNESDSEGLFG